MLNFVPKITNREVCHAVFKRNPPSSFCLFILQNLPTFLQIYCATGCIKYYYFKCVRLLHVKNVCYGQLKLSIFNLSVLSVCVLLHDTIVKLGLYFVVGLNKTHYEPLFKNQFRNSPIVSYKFFFLHLILRPPPFLFTIRNWLYSRNFITLQNAIPSRYQLIMPSMFILEMCIMASSK